MRPVIKVPIMAFLLLSPLFITCGAKLLNADWLRQRAFFLITRAVLVIKRAWLLDADWLSTPALSWFPTSNVFWKGNLRNAVDLNTVIHLNVKNTVFWWKSKRIFPTKNVLILSLKNVWVAGVARSIKLQNFMAAKLKVNFFILLRVALLVLQLTLSA